MPQPRFSEGSSRALSLSGAVLSLLGGNYFFEDFSSYSVASSPKSTFPSSARFTLKPLQTPVPLTSSEPPSANATKSMAVFMDQYTNSLFTICRPGARTRDVRGANAEEDATRNTRGENFILVVGPIDARENLRISPTSQLACQAPYTRHHLIVPGQIEQKEHPPTVGE